jgi:hypothetical protein
LFGAGPTPRCLRMCKRQPHAALDFRQSTLHARHPSRVRTNYVESAAAVEL